VRYIIKDLVMALGIGDGQEEVNVLPGSCGVALMQPGRLGITTSNSGINDGTGLTFDKSVSECIFL
jgi:hypothetical protein